MNRHPCCVPCPEKNMEEHLFPFNVAGTQSGTELAVAMDKLACGVIRADPNFVHVQIDYRNAFNMLFRKWMRTTFERYCPELLRFLDLLYASHGTIFYGRDVVI